MSADAVAKLDQNLNADIPQVGEYIFYPNLGLSIIGGIKEEEMYGVSFQGLVVRPINDLQSPITIPLNKLEQSNIKRVASHDEMESALNILKLQKQKNNSPRWNQRQKAIEEDLNSNDIERIAHVVKDSIIRFRNNQLNIKELSYSEAQLFEKALDILADHLAFNTGLSRANAAEHIKTLAHKPRKTQLWPAQRSEPLPNYMTDDDFEDLFGISKEDAGVGEISLEVRGESKLVRAKNTGSKGASQNVTLASRPTQAGAKKTASDALRATNRDQAKSEVYQREVKYYSGGGMSAKAFEFALVRLEPRQAEVLSMYLTRPSQDRMAISDISKHFDLEGAVIEGIISHSINVLRQYAQVDRKLTLMKNILSWHKALTNSGNVSNQKLIRTKPENKAFFEQELEAEKIPSLGVPKKAFLQAAELLDPQAFKILTLIKIRMSEFRLTPQQVAEEMNLSVEEVIKIHDQSADILRQDAIDKRDGKVFIRVPGVYQKWSDYIQGVSPLQQRQSKDFIVLDHNLSAYQREKESGMLPAKGELKGVFSKAAGLVDEHEFEALIRLELRSPHHRLNVQEAANDLGISVEQLIANRDSGAQKLFDKFIEKDADGNPTRKKLLGVYKSWAEANQRPSVRKKPAPVRQFFAPSRQEDAAEEPPAAELPKGREPQGQVSRLDNDRTTQSSRGMAKVELSIPSSLVKAGKILAVHFGQASDENGKPVIERVIVIDGTTELDVSQSNIDFDKD